MIGRGISLMIGREHWVCLPRQAAGHSALTADCMKQEEREREARGRAPRRYPVLTAHGRMKEEREAEEESTHLGEDLERELLGGRRKWLAVEQAAQGQKTGGGWEVLAACMRLFTQQLLAPFKQPHTVQPTDVQSMQTFGHVNSPKQATPPSKQ